MERDECDMVSVLLMDPGQFATLTICPLGEPTSPSQGESPFPLTFTYHGCPPLSSLQSKPRFYPFGV
jgi:hypothetical protein